MRLFVNNVMGQISNDPLEVSGDTITGEFLAKLPVVSGVDYVVLVLDPQGLDGDPEIVHVVEHEELATSARIERGKEGTTPREHAEGTRVVAPVTAADLSYLNNEIMAHATTLSFVENKAIGHDSEIQEIRDDLGDLDGVVQGLVASVAGLTSGLASAVPVGTILPFAGTAAPAGFRLCNGDEVSRTQYSDLFNVIGTRYGAGNGSSTFNLPNLQGRFPLGRATSGTGSELGETGGELDHKHEVAAHSHGVGTLQMSSTGAHTHSVSGKTGARSVAHTHSLGGSTGSGGGGSTGSAGSHSHSMGSSNNNRQAGDLPSGVTVSLAFGNHTHTVNSAGSHSHSVSAHSHDLPANTGAASSTNHDHDVSLNTNSQGNHTHSLSGNTSQQGAVNTTGANPPYLVLNFIIKV